VTDATPDCPNAWSSDAVNDNDSEPTVVAPMLLTVDTPVVLSVSAPDVAACVLP
jgi:hypothetical protein